MNPLFVHQFFVSKKKIVWKFHFIALNKFASFYTSRICRNLIFFQLAINNCSDFKQFWVPMDLESWRIMEYSEKLISCTFNWKNSWLTEFLLVRRNCNEGWSFKGSLIEGRMARISVYVHTERMYIAGRAPEQKSVQQVSSAAHLVVVVVVDDI